MPFFNPGFFNPEIPHRILVGKVRVPAFMNDKLIRKLQPEAVIAVVGPDVRWVGTETGYGREQKWSVVPANHLDKEAIAARSRQGLIWYPAETDVSIRPGWFYHEKEDDKVKSPGKLLDIYNSSASTGQSRCPEGRRVFIRRP